MGLTSLTLAHDFRCHGYDEVGNTELALRKQQINIGKQSVCWIRLSLIFCLVERRVRLFANSSALPEKRILQRRLQRNSLMGTTADLIARGSWISGHEDPSGMSG